MAQAGLDPAYLDKEFPDYRTLPRYKYFFDERRRGVATDVLKQRMIAEHLDENVLDVYDVEDIHTIRVDYQRTLSTSEGRKLERMWRRFRWRWKRLAWTLLSSSMM